jgi:hypothetical protein
MLKELTKIANKLDKLGLTKEADLLDKIITKMAGMGEGPPAYMSAGPEDSDLQMTEEGELEYPEGTTLMQSRTLPADSMRSETRLSELGKEIFSMIKSAMNNVWEVEGEADRNLFRIESKINKIKGTLVRSYGNDLDSREDVKESIESLLHIIEKDEGGSSPIPMYPGWAFFGEEEYHLLDTEDYIGNDIQKLTNAVVRLKQYFDNGCNKIENYKDVFAELESETAYSEMNEVAEIIEPAAALVYQVDDIVGSVKKLVDRKYEEFKKLLRPEMKKKTPSAYILPPDVTGWDRITDTSPEQARFEESQIPIGDADVGDTEDLDWYMRREEEEEED